MEKQINQFVALSKERIAGTKTLAEVNDIRVRLLGKNGELTQKLKGLRDLPEDQRPYIGKIVNAARLELESELDQRSSLLYMQELDQKLHNEKIDITIPVKKTALGKMHPLTETKYKMIDFFAGLGFSVMESPEIEYAKYNFDMLNIPMDHPSRDVQDTFYISDSILLRTQTSTGQIRAMEMADPPIKILSPGRVFRPDEVDATHTPCFHQLEGLVVDKGITMCDLKGLLELFAKHFFSSTTSVRLRPSFFPFTEPSIEMDATCPKCCGQGCTICKGNGWIEIMGAGIVNRNVLDGCGIDPDVYTGFAFGMGLDRITAIIHGISDARLPFEGDIRFLKQF